MLVALGMVALGGIMLGIGWAAGSRGGNVSIERWFPPRVSVWPVRSGGADFEDSSAFEAFGPMDGIAEIRIAATSASIAVVPAAPGDPAGARFGNLEPSLRRAGDALIIDTRDYERRWTRSLNMFNFHYARREILVELPAGWEGSVAISNVNGGARVEDLSLASLEAGTTSGSIRLRGLSARALSLSATNGAISGVGLDFIDGSARSVSGSIRFEDSSWESLTAGATNGSIRVSGARLGSRGSTRLTTVSGSVELEALGAREDFSYSLSTVNGSIAVDGQRVGGRSASGGSGAYQIALRTTNGSIRLGFVSR